MANNKRIVHPLYAPGYKSGEVKYTRGGEYMVSDTYEEYVGVYHISSTGIIYSEAEYDKYNSVQLEKIELPILTNADTKKYLKLTNRKFSNYILPSYYIPVITETDKQQGAFRRFVAQKKNEPNIIIEIDKDQYQKANTSNSIGIDKNQWNVQIIFWTIKGAYSDIVQTNRKVLSSAESTMPGISKYFTDLAEFIQVPISGDDRIYTDGAPVPSILPTSYKLHTAPDVPLGQQCGNCIFKSNHGCQKWNAQVRNNYWCQAWKHGVR